MIEARFYETYYCCNAINNILHNQFDYIRSIGEFYENDICGLVTPYNKHSVFHSFIEYVVDEIINDQSNEVNIEERIKDIDKFKDIPSALKELDLYRLPVERALSYHNIKHTSFLEFIKSRNKDFVNADSDDIYEYLQEIRMTGELDDLQILITREVFHVLFQNRELLLLFNDLMASAVEYSVDEIQQSESAGLLMSNGTLRRQHMPKWVKRAVFFRDRGRCVLCNRDISGLVNLDNLENYDHIVPLFKHGLNDVSNIQLLCKECNQKDKRHKKVVTSIKYQSWYDY